ncbi:MAG: hypothetical protein IMZ60_00075 [Actinobacteria bacterium]|nr:hypothetical protein [Actinomycetota bacterium]
MIESKLYTFLCSAFFALSVLLPDISYPIIGNLRPEDFVLILLGLCVLDNILLKNGQFPKLGWPVFVMLLMFVWLVTVSSGINFLLGNVDNSGLIIKEFIRFLKYAVVFVVFLWLKPEKANTPFRVFLFAALLTVGIQFLQKYQLFDINNWLINFYNNRAFIYSTQSSDWRGGSVFSNPNVFGNFLLLPFAFIFSTFFVSGEIFYHIKLKKLTYLILIMIFGLGILFTQSRTSIMVMFIIIFFVTLIYVFKEAVYHNRNRGKSTKYIGYVILFLFFIILASRYFNLERAFAFISATGVNDSLSVKLRMLKEATAVVLSANPLCLLFGMSPGVKYIQTDFEYGYLLYWYGLSGILFYGLLVYSQLQIFSKRLGTQSGLTGMSIVFAFIFFGIGATAFINNRVYPITLALFAMMINDLSSSLNIKNASETEFSSTSADVNKSNE